jgi:hypothetical protein
MNNELGPVGKLLENDSHWMHTGTAANKNGHHVPVQHPEAYSFSVRGALMLCYPQTHMQKQQEFMECAQKYYPNISWEKLNNALTHQILMMLLKETGL